MTAHRLSTLRRVTEQCTHDELLARGGIYASLVATQLAGMAGSRS